MLGLDKASAILHEFPVLVILRAKPIVGFPIELGARCREHHRSKIL
jgi:hypothetical protein